MKKIFIIGLSFLWAITLVPVMAQSNDELSRGLAALQKKDYPQAEKVFSDIIRQQPENLKTIVLRGEAHFYQRDYEKALMDFYKVDQKKPGLASLWIARTYAMKRDRGKAIKALEEHLRSSYRRPESEIKLDTLLHSLEDTPEWRALWKKDWYSQREKGIAEVRFDLTEKDPLSALKGINRLLAHYPKDPHLWALHGRANMKAGDLKKADQDVRKALSFEPDDTMALYTAAQLARRTESYGEEAGYWVKLYQKTPERFSLLLEISDAWDHDGQYVKALKPLQKYMKYFPDDVEAVFRAGELAGKTNHYKEALKYFSEVIDKDPSKPMHFIARGDMYVKVHTYRYAVDDYAMALDLDPTNGDVYFSRALAYLKMSDTKNACFDFRQALHYGKKEAVSYLQSYCGY